MLVGADFRFSLNDADRSRAAHLTQETPDALLGSLRDDPDTLFSCSMAFFEPTKELLALLHRTRQEPQVCLCGLVGLPHAIGEVG